MLTNESIINRFFEMLDILKASGASRGTAEFCNRYGIDRRNLYHLQQDPSRNIFKVQWLAHLVVDYAVSAEWLLTGVGDRFSNPEIAKNPQRLRSILVRLSPFQS